MEKSTSKFSITPGVNGVNPSHDFLSTQQKQMINRLLCDGKVQIAREYYTELYNKYLNSQE